MSYAGAEPATLFLCGDVMTGRGVDQALPRPGDTRLYEPSVKNASEYLTLAETVNGPLPRPLDFSYIWGDALALFEREKPLAKIINLETAITRSDRPWPSKDVHYKMSPENIACLATAKIDCCTLANNHTLDWGIAGLLETLDTLDKENIKHTGAGRNLREAQAPATLKTGEGSRAIVFSLGSTSSGIPAEWAARENRPGLYMMESAAEDVVEIVAKGVAAIKWPGDIVIASIHWGGNWGYRIPSSQSSLAHRLVDEAGVDIVHGHSSHHVKGIELYHERLILYGCGDFFNDYEGISGYEHFRGDLGLMYFADVDSVTGKLLALRMIPTQIRRFRLNRACASDSRWLAHLLNREGKRFRTSVQTSAENSLVLSWG
jgi:poly-gamma-glutamate capsule biosynthesis protein CapA/YwtB (metallophosphatase superfamily)